jgi:hypothetical protein
MTPKTEQCKTKCWLVFLLEVNSAMTVQSDKTLSPVIKNSARKFSYCHEQIMDYLPQRNCTNIMSYMANNAPFLKQL